MYAAQEISSSGLLELAFSTENLCRFAVTTRKLSLIWLLNMSDSNFHLGAFYARVPPQPSPSLGPSNQSRDDIQSETGLPSDEPANDNQPELGGQVPHAPTRLQQVPAENPTHATNRRLGM